MAIEQGVSKARRAAGEDFFAAYAPPQGVYDELLSDPGAVRPHWQSFVQAVNRLGQGEFTRLWDQAQRVVHEHGIAFSAYGDPDERPRPWRLDPMPLLIEGEQWRAVSTALEQRARLLNLILADLFGPQRLLQEGHLPPEVLFLHPGFRRPYHAQQSAESRFLHFYAADLTRSPDGTWWVLADRTEAPSGAGYALENRIVISRMLPGIFRSCRVDRLAPYFVALRETMHELAPAQRDNPRVVVLSQGPQSPNYFENAYLARYLGYTLVEADDLAVRNNRVMLKTLGGLLGVDVVLRRPNSECCDPLELDGTTSTAVTGLLHAARSGNVAVANILGSGVVESPLFMALLPQLCKTLLGEELKLASVATWWCGDPESLTYVLEHLDTLTVKRAFRHRGQELQFSKSLGTMTGEDLANLIRATPSTFVAQEMVNRSSTPVWDNGTLTASHIAVRAFLVASGDGYNVMQGGLARVSQSSDPLELSILAGEGSKDLWVLADEPVNPVTLLDKPGQPVELRRSGAELPSRVADNLYWLGRHMERADAVARLLRAITLRLTDESDPSAISELPSLLRVLVEQGQLEPGFLLEGLREQLPAIEQILPRCIFDETQAASLRSVLSQMFRVASIVRDRMSLDTWHILHRINEQLRPIAGDTQLSDVLPMIDGLIIDLAAFHGMVMESMTRTQGWRFLDLGRRLERGLQTIGLLKHALVSRGNIPSSLLEAVLEISDSLMTYRSRYLANLQLGAVLDLLLTDETNPRSVAYQVSMLADHVEKLPRERSQAVYAPEQRLAMAALHTIRMVDVQVLADLHALGERNHLQRLLENLEAQLPQLSNAISNKYLIHAGSPHHLGEIRPE